MITEAQELVRSLSPGLYPLLTIPLSLSQGWHCATMCGPNFSAKATAEKESFLIGRLVSYTSACAVCGFFGSGLKKLLEIQAIGAVAFIVFFGISLMLILSSLGRGSKWFSFSRFGLSRIQTKSAFAQGLLSVAIPCGLMTQIFGLSIVSNSIIGGALIGLSHAMTSSLSLWATSKAATKLSLHLRKYQFLFKFALVGIILFNLLYFAGILLFTEDGAKSKILFCF